MKIEDLKKLANGKWRGILASLGVDVPDDTKRHGPCPTCGGSDRFRFDDLGGNGTWICNQCEPQSGDGISLVQRSLGLSIPEAIKRIAEVAGYCDYSKEEKPQADPRKALNAVWVSGKPLSGDDLASQYLRGRGLIIAPQDLRYVAECYEPETKTKMPAMVALVRNKEGKPVTIHRTYLKGPAKAPIEQPKKLMPGVEKLHGAAIRLFPVGKDNDHVGVAEGIETAIAASQLYFFPVWATISTTVMETFEPPQGIRRITVFADNDANFAGQKSAYRLANKLYLQDFIVDVEVPTLGDFCEHVEHQMKRSA